MLSEKANWEADKWFGSISITVKPAWSPVATGWPDALLHGKVHARVKVINLVSIFLRLFKESVYR